MRERHPSAAALADDRVLVTGGRGHSGSPDVAGSAEIHDPGTGTWQETAPMGAARRQHSATPLADGSVLVAGGGIGAALRSAEIFQLDQDPQTCWTPPRESGTPPLPPASPPPVLCPRT
ncbi:MAG: kelch repeat-containing protein [Egibacteraceae bacterium]